VGGGGSVVGILRLPVTSDAHLKRRPQPLGQAVGEELSLGGGAEVEPDEIEGVAEGMLAHHVSPIPRRAAAEGTVVADELRGSPVHFARGLRGDLLELLEALTEGRIDQHRAGVAELQAPVRDHAFLIARHRLARRQPPLELVEGVGIATQLVPSGQESGLRERRATGIRTLAEISTAWLRVHGARGQPERHAHGTKRMRHVVQYAHAMSARNGSAIPGIGPRFARQFLMPQPSVNRRRRVAGLSCSALILVAGVVALSNEVGIAIASGLLTLAGIGGLAAFASAKNPKAISSYAVLLAAALPLFFGFYIAGLQVLRVLGQAAAGGLLIGLSVVVAVVTFFVTAQRRAPLPH
jgi:hypothetical protein